MVPQLTDFLGEARVEQYAKGEWIYSPGDPSEFMYTVLRGKVAILFGGSVILRAKEGDIFGEWEFINYHARTTRAIAETDSVIVAVDRERFLTVAKFNAWVPIALLEKICLRYETLLLLNPN